MKFLIEKDIFDDGIPDKFKIALEKRNQYTRVLEYIPFADKQIFDEFDCDEPIFVYGSINLFKRLQYQKAHDQLRAPLVDYCPWNMFRTSVIYNRLKGDVLTNMYRVMRVSDVLENLSWVFAKHGSDENSENPQVFCKSDEGDKSFNGGLYNIVELERYLEMNINTEYIKPNDLVVVAEPKLITKEYRIVVSTHECDQQPRYITGSHYMTGGDLIKNPTDEVPKRIKDYVAGVIANSKYKPAPVFVVDVAEVVYGHHGLPKIVETGSIHMCGLYGCDVQKIVDELIKVNL